VTSSDLLWLLVDRDEAQLEPMPFDFTLRLADSDREALAFAA
jgi:hypothetical protein